MKLMIGNSTYDVGFDPRLIEGRSLGEVDYQHKTITVYDRMADETIGQSLWHEVIHAILDEMQQLELDKDEEFVESLARHIYALLTRNNLAELREEIGVGLCG